MTSRDLIERICWLGLIAILAAVVLGRLSFLVPFLDWLAHFPAVYFLAAAVFTLALAAIGRWSSACFGLVVALACIVLFLGPFIPRRGRHAPVPEPNLTVAVANVSIANPYRDEIVSTLPDIDLLALLETGTAWTDTLDSLKSRWPWQWRELRDTPFGLSVLSRHPVTSAQWFKLTPGDAPALHVKLRVDGIDVDVLVIHTMSPQSPGMLLTRDAQFRTLAEIINELSTNVVVIGDLNATAWSSSMQHMMDMTGLRQSRTVEGIRGALLGTWPSQAPSVLRIAIDHCLIRGNIEPVSNRTIPLKWSDHHGLVVDLAVSSP
ncbi:MAG: endonuclease/exonuclease/phosphatase family protein [Phycisphaerales bacterium]|nr:endonuclease/exonuclease/phosphatase family protein [Phycisphaerales bacterium]